MLPRGVTRWGDAAAPRGGSARGLTPFGRVVRGVVPRGVSPCFALPRGVRRRGVLLFRGVREGGTGLGITRLATRGRGVAFLGAGDLRCSGDGLAMGVTGGEREPETVLDATEAFAGWHAAPTVSVVDAEMRGVAGRIICTSMSTSWARSPLG